MENVLIQKIRLQSRDCDFTGRWKPSEIFMAMQEWAGMHSAILGAGYDQLRGLSLAFALTRTELHMERYPRMGDTVVCRTWAAPVMKWMFPRYFIFEDENGERLGYAATIWVLLDLKERKMVSPAALDAPIATAAEKAPMRMPGKAALPSDQALKRSYMPGYSEIDVNGHVNNTRYVSWMSDALGAEIFRERSVRKLIVNYTHEILPGQAVELSHELVGNAFCMSGDCDGVNHFTLSGELA